jgi:hypothetical protein
VVVSESESNVVAAASQPARRRWRTESATSAVQPLCGRVSTQTNLAQETRTSTWSRASTLTQGCFLVRSTNGCRLYYYWKPAEKGVNSVLVMKSINLDNALTTSPSTSVP